MMNFLIRKYYDQFIIKFNNLSLDSKFKCIDLPGFAYMIHHLEEELNTGVSIFQTNILAYFDFKKEISRTPLQFTLNLRNILRNFPEFLEKTKFREIFRLAWKLS